MMNEEEKLCMKKRNDERNNEMMNEKNRIDG